MLHLNSNNLSQQPTYNIQDILRDIYVLSVVQSSPRLRSGVYFLYNEMYSVINRNWINKYHKTIRNLSCFKDHKNYKNYEMHRANIDQFVYTVSQNVRRLV